MNDVLNKIYGDLVAEEEYRMPKGVPVYISQGYEYRQLAFEDQRCLLAKPKGNDWNIAGLKKQANQIEECLGQKVVLDLYRLSAHQRENLIRSGIAFISGTGQLFIPFWGSYFEARITNPHEKREQMTDNAQLVFLTLY
ncbi:MAG: hypothetical protein ILO68_07075, partial [Clostridia bacterium]|nr:hypothetical protein [Clostridia bacterium]